MNLLAYMKCICQALECGLGEEVFLSASPVACSVLNYKGP